MRPRPAPEPRVARWRSRLVAAGALAVTAVAVGVTVVRARRSRAAVATGSSPDALRGYRPRARAGTPPPAGDLVLALPPMEAAATAGALPITPERAALELREERRFESAIFVRSILILVGIALLLTARTIWVG